MTEQFTEYAIRVTLPGYSPRITPYSSFPRDAIRGYDHAVELHGRDAVEFLTRQVRRTDWVAGKLPPPPAPPDRDGGVCDPQPWVKPTVVVGSIDTYEDAGGVDARVREYGQRLGEVLQAWRGEQA